MDAHGISAVRTPRSGSLGGLKSGTTRLTLARSPLLPSRSSRMFRSCCKHCNGGTLQLASRCGAFSRHSRGRRPFDGCRSPRVGLRPQAAERGWQAAEPHPQAVLPCARGARMSLASQRTLRPGRCGLPANRRTLRARQNVLRASRNVSCASPQALRPDQIALRPDQIALRASQKALPAKQKALRLGSGGGRVAHPTAQLGVHCTVLAVLVGLFVGLPVPSRTVGARREKRADMPWRRASKPEPSPTTRSRA